MSQKLQRELKVYLKNSNLEISQKKSLVIDGVGTIRSNFIKALLKFELVKFVVVDIKENRLREVIDYFFMKQKIIYFNFSFLSK